MGGWNKKLIYFFFGLVEATQQVRNRCDRKKIETEFSQGTFHNSQLNNPEIGATRKKLKQNSPKELSTTHSPTTTQK
jgi:hypothetical protein